MMELLPYERAMYVCMYVTILLKFPMSCPGNRGNLSDSKYGKGIEGELVVGSGTRFAGATVVVSIARVGD